MRSTTFITSACVVLFSFFLAGCDTSSLVDSSEEFVANSARALVSDAKELVGLGGDEDEEYTKPDAEMISDNDAGDKEMADGDVSDKEDFGNEDTDKPSDKRDVEDGSKAEKESGKLHMDASLEKEGSEAGSSGIEGVTKSDLKIKKSAKERFDTDKVYGFVTKDDVLLLSYSADFEDKGSYIGYAKCINDTFETDDVLRIKEFKSYEEDSYSQDGKDLENVILLTSYKKLLPEEIAKESGKAIGSDEDFVIPDSAQRIIDEDELDELSKEQCDIARNEIYARHGRMFKNSELQDYFNSKSWYSPEYEPNDFPESVLNKTEKKNAYTILEYEKKKGYI